MHTPKSLMVGGGIYHKKSESKTLINLPLRLPQINLKADFVIDTSRKVVASHS